jgi:hypothetical protein
MRAGQRRAAFECALTDVSVRSVADGDSLALKKMTSGPADATVLARNS